MSSDSKQVLMPTEVSSRVGFFDTFAGLAAKLASRALFAFCLGLVVVWLIQGVTLVASRGIDPAVPRFSMIKRHSTS